MKMISIVKSDKSEFLIERLVETNGLSKDGFTYIVKVDGLTRMITDDYNTARELVAQYE